MNKKIFKRFINFFLGDEYSLKTYHLRTIKNKILKINPNIQYKNFEKHEKSIKKKYGDNEDFSIKYLNFEFNTKIKSYLKQLKPIKLNSDNFAENCSVNSSALIQSKFSFKLFDNIFKNVYGASWELDPKDPIVKELYSYIKDLFSNYIKSPFTIVNSRAWITKVNSLRRGPAANHTDGFADGHLKIMIYPNGLSKEIGSLEIKGNIISNKKPGCCIAFKNSDAPHSAIPGISKERLVIELTIMRTFVQTYQNTSSHFNGRHYSNPKFAYIYENTSSNTLPKFETRLINLGSGKKSWENWLLIDDLQHENIYTYNFKNNSNLPVENDSADLIYSYNLLQTLNNKDIENIFSESFRVLENKGFLIIKITAFDKLLTLYKSNNKKALKEILPKTIKNNLLKILNSSSIENYLASLICSYQNIYYDEKLGYEKQNKLAYYGAPKLKNTYLRKLLLEKDALEIFNTLSQFAMKDKSFKLFKNQNPISEEQIIKIALKYKLNKLHWSKEHIFNLLGRKIPDFWNEHKSCNFLIFTKEISLN